MAKYTGKPAVINRPVEELYARFSDMSALEQAVKARSEETARMGEVKVDKDSLTIVSPQVGEIRFEVTERVEPSRIAYTAVNSPLPIGLTINLKPIDEATTEVSTLIDIDIPAVMKPFIGPKLQQVADQFGGMMGSFGR